MTTDVSATPRKPMSQTRALRIFEAHKGVCHICERKIQAGEKWEVEHVIPLALGGADDDSNMAPAHEKCHAIKTKADNKSWSKAKRRKAKHIGIKKPSTFPKPPPGSRYDWKAKRYVVEKVS